MKVILLFQFNYKKALSLTIMSFCLGLIFSCDRPPAYSEDIYYNSLEINGINNTGEWGIHVNYQDTIDTLYSDAVAISIKLMDSSHYFLSDYSSNNNNMYLKTTTNDIGIIFNPVDKVVDIEFYTVFEINKNFNSGDNISDSVFYLTDNQFNNLYKTKHEVIDFLNKKNSDAFPIVFAIVKPSIENNKAKFISKIILDNGETLTDSTKTFTIIPSYP